MRGVGVPEWEGGILAPVPTREIGRGGYPCPHYAEACNPGFSAAAQAATLDHERTLRSGLSRSMNIAGFFALRKIHQNLKEKPVLN